jgi:hypothetical protein
MYVCMYVYIYTYIYIYIYATVYLYTRNRADGMRERQEWRGRTAARKVLTWPRRPQDLRPGINDSWNSYQAAHPGRQCQPSEWRSARESMLQAKKELGSHQGGGEQEEEQEEQEEQEEEEDTEAQAGMGGGAGHALDEGRARGQRRTFLPVQRYKPYSSSRDAGRCVGGGVGVGSRSGGGGHAGKGGALKRRARSRCAADRRGNKRRRSAQVLQGKPFAMEEGRGITEGREEEEEEEQDAEEEEEYMEGEEEEAVGMDGEEEEYVEEEAVTLWGGGVEAYSDALRNMNLKTWLLEHLELSVDEAGAVETCLLAAVTSDSGSGWIRNYIYIYTHIHVCV